MQKSPGWAKRAAGVALAVFIVFSALPAAALGLGGENGEGGGDGQNVGEQGGPFVDAPHLSAGTVTPGKREAPPFTAGSTRA
jgi:hypothetical protein